MWFLYFFTLLFALVLTSYSAPIGSEMKALSYLVHFGYAEGSSSGSKNSGSLVSGESFKNSLMDFQRFAGLNQTGELDQPTVEAMSLPRCGVKDKVGHGIEAKRKKRYAIQGSRWRVSELTYRVSKYPSGLEKSQVDDEIKKAFKAWSDHTNLNFVHKSSGKVHIDVRFEKGEHGDGDPFDGSGGTLAHAYFPLYGGDAHFDDEERWTINRYSGTNLLQVAAHEFGHSLGLSHSDIQSALMAPFYRGYNANFALHSDDVKGIQKLYGKKSSETPTKPGAGTPDGKPSVGKPTPGVEDGELCTDSSIDTIFTSKKRTFTFKGDLYWEVKDEDLADGYPRSISRDWDGLPSNIDAAFTWHNGKTYFFKGSQYWRYTDRKKDSGYPKSISDGFKGIPDSLDAAFVWSGNDKIYFFKGSKYWKFDPEKNPQVARDYPKAVSTWQKIPDNIDGAFQWTNGFTYFFKGRYYWRFNDRTFSVDTANPSFPRSSATWWFGCKSMSADKPGQSELKSADDYRLDVDDVSEDVGLHQGPPTQGALEKGSYNSASSWTASVVVFVLCILVNVFH